MLLGLHQVGDITHNTEILDKPSLLVPDGHAADGIPAGGLIDGRIVEVVDGIERLALHEHLCQVPLGFVTMTLVQGLEILLQGLGKLRL